MTVSYSERFVADATPLMKIETIPGAYNLYKKIFKELYLPLEVANELARGLDISRDEYFKLYDISDFVTVSPINIDQGIIGISELDKGEAEALSLAKSMSYPLLIEERKGRRIAKDNHISFTGNGGLVLYGFRHQKLTQTEALQALSDLHRVGCFKQNLYQKFVSALLTIEKER